MNGDGWTTGNDALKVIGKEYLIGRGHRFIDLTGQRFGKWIVLKYAYSKAYTKSTQSYWLCKCNCGNENEVASCSLLSDKSRSCRDCYETLNNPFKGNVINRKDMSNQNFNFIKVLEYSHTEGGRAIYNAICLLCGKNFKRNSNNLKRFISCGCAQTKESKAKIAARIKEIEDAIRESET